MTSDFDVSAVRGLFVPCRLGTLTLPNRVVMAPMTRKQSPHGVPSAAVAAYYRLRAQCGVGLLISEGTFIDDPASGDDTNVPRFYGDDAIAGWMAVLREVHAAGGRIVPQLWHMGALRHERAGQHPAAPPIGPSGIGPAGRLVGAPMSEARIAHIVAAYAAGARLARELGFDGVELHGAHGYLIDQFFWSRTNQRTDRYGGDLCARSAFAAEIVRACRRGVGNHFPILFRYSQWKLQDYRARLATTPQELATLLAPLVEAGVDVFHCSTRYFWKPEFEGSPLNLAGWTRKLTGKPVITVGAIGQSEDFLGIPCADDRGPGRLARLGEMIASGEVDLVAVGRALLADPEWVVKVRDGRAHEIRPFSHQMLETLA